MSNTVSISATKREELGTASSRRIRRAGMIPAVVYGHGNEAAAITISPEDAAKATAHSGLVEIVCSCGARKMAVVRKFSITPSTLASSILISWKSPWTRSSPAPFRSSQ